MPTVRIAKNSHDCTMIVSIDLCAALKLDAVADPVDASPWARPIGWTSISPGTRCTDALRPRRAQNRPNTTTPASPGAKEGATAT
jgi:hypothetical protein